VLGNRLMTQTRQPFATSQDYEGSGTFEVVDATSLRVTASITATMTVVIQDNILDPADPMLATVFQPRGRCVCIIDEVVDAEYGSSIRSYFKRHGIELLIRGFPANEDNKSLRSLESMIAYLGTDQCDVSRSESVLVIGGGVISDVAGLACALLNRRTPYVMLTTSLVAAIDAGPSPRTCVNVDGFKNGIGAYHLPTLTIVDPRMFRSLPSRYIRHGLAEVLKMAIVDDLGLFEALEGLGNGAVAFMTSSADPTSSTAVRRRALLHRALSSYLRHEGPNAYEIYQDRPHAFGHTWSPAFELSTNLLHGHAVAVDICLSSTVAYLSGYISDADWRRVLRLTELLGLTTYHPIIADANALRKGQEKMQRKRGGRSLWAPVPVEGLGKCDFLEDVSPALLSASANRLRRHSAEAPNRGMGIEAFREPTT